MMVKGGVCVVGLNVMVVKGGVFWGFYDDGRCLP